MSAPKQSGIDRTELDRIEALNIEIGVAETTKDVARLTVLLDDRLLFRTAKPAVINKAAFLARFDDPHLKTRSLTTEVIHVTPLPAGEGPPQVLVECRVTLDRTASNDDGIPEVGHPGPFWNVRIWEYGGNGWRLVAWFNHLQPGARSVGDASSRPTPSPAPARAK